MLICTEVNMKRLPLSPMYFVQGQAKATPWTIFAKVKYLLSPWPKPAQFQIPHNSKKQLRNEVPGLYLEHLRTKKTNQIAKVWFSLLAHTASKHLWGISLRTAHEDTGTLNKAKAAPTHQACDSEAWHFSLHNPLNPNYIYCFSAFSFDLCRISNGAVPFVLWRWKLFLMSAQIGWGQNSQIWKTLWLFSTPPWRPLGSLCNAKDHQTPAVLIILIHKGQWPFWYLFVVNVACVQLLLP